MICYCKEEAKEEKESQENATRTSDVVKGDERYIKNNDKVTIHFIDSQPLQMVAHVLNSFNLANEQREYD